MYPSRKLFTHPLHLLWLPTALALLLYAISASAMASAMPAAGITPSVAAAFHTDSSAGPGADLPASIAATAAFAEQPPGEDGGNLCMSQAPALPLLRTASPSSARTTAEWPCAVEPSPD